MKIFLINYSSINTVVLKVIFAKILLILMSYIVKFQVKYSYLEVIFMVAFKG